MSDKIIKFPIPSPLKFNCKNSPYDLTGEPIRMKIDLGGLTMQSPQTKYKVLDNSGVVTTFSLADVKTFQEHFNKGQKDRVNNIQELYMDQYGTKNGRLAEHAYTLGVYYVENKKLSGKPIDFLNLNGPVPAAHILANFIVNNPNWYNLSCTKENINEVNKLLGQPKRRPGAKF
jgi:hypothetical protein